MIGTTYTSTKARGAFKGRKYRIDYEKRIVEFTINDGISWRRSMYSVEDMKEHIRTKHMVEVELV